ncbi:MAG: nuclear transport factor 2 family protein, partial [Pseudomonadota bacterium]
QAYDKALQLDSSNAVTQSKLSLSRELISASSKPGVRAIISSKTSSEAKPNLSQPNPSVASASAIAANSNTHVTANPALNKNNESSKNDKAVADKASEKVAEPKSTAPTALEPAEAELVAFLQDWAAAWSQKNVKTYLAKYAADFQTPKGMARKAWEAERTRRIDKPGQIQIDIEDFKIKLNGDTATVRFRQHYRAIGLKSNSWKTISLNKYNGKWLINKESVN